MITLKDKFINEIGSLSEEFVNKIIDSFTLGICLDTHRLLKCKLFREVDAKPYLKQNTPQINVNIPRIISKNFINSFNNNYEYIKNYQCSCLNCNRNIAACRFAPHLEKCLGMGRNSSRLASKKIKRSIYIENTFSNDELVDDTSLSNTENMSEYLYDYDNPNSNKTDESSVSTASNTSVSKLVNSKKSISTLIKRKRKTKIKSSLESCTNALTTQSIAANSDFVLPTKSSVEVTNCMMKPAFHYTNPSSTNTNDTTNFALSNFLFDTLANNNTTINNNFAHPNVITLPGRNRLAISKCAKKTDNHITNDTNITHYAIKKLAEIEVGDIAVLKLSFLLAQNLVPKGCEKDNNLMASSNHKKHVSRLHYNANNINNANRSGEDFHVNRWIGEVTKLTHESQKSIATIDLKWLDIIIDHPVESGSLFKNYLSAHTYRLIECDNQPHTSKLRNEKFVIKKEPPNTKLHNVDKNAIAIAFKFDISQTMPSELMKLLEQSYLNS